MEKKLWINAEVVELGVESTKEQTRDFPHYWACNGCGKHYISVFEPKHACERCGSTMGYTWTKGDGDAVNIPEHGDNKPSVFPGLS